MKWNQHPELGDSHAVLSPSRAAYWRRKNDDELIESYINSFAPTIGTLLHAYAADRILYREKLKKTDVSSVKFELLRNKIPEIAIDLRLIFPTLMSYVNDAIGFRMDPEVRLKYSARCHGTADAIFVDGDILRIHDLKTGSITPAKMDQLLVYAGLFFLEYGEAGYTPERFKTHLRIYQSGEIVIYEPDLDEIRAVMQDIIEKDKTLLVSAMG